MAEEGSRYQKYFGLIWGFGFVGVGILFFLLILLQFKLFKFAVSENILLNPFYIPSIVTFWGSTAYLLGFPGGSGAALLIYHLILFLAVSWIFYILSYVYYGKIKYKFNRYFIIFLILQIFLVNPLVFHYILGPEPIGDGLAGMAVIGSFPLSFLAFPILGLIYHVMTRNRTIGTVLLGIISVILILLILSRSNWYILQSIM